MKKLAILLAVLILVITFASCDIDGIIARLPYDIENWHEHSWDNWTHVYDETQVHLVCSVCNVTVRSYPISQGLEIDENGVLVGRGTCTDLYVVVPQGVTAVGEGAFANTKDILGVLLPDTVTKIEDNAFKSCDALQVINIPNGVTEIGEKAFHSCKSLIGVLIPHSVTSIGKQAFANCGYLEIIYYVGTEADWENVEKGQNWNQGAGKHVIEFKFVIGDDPIPHVHEWSKWVTSTKPTCSNKGVVTKSCSCGLEIEEVWPKAPHHIVNGMCTICQSAVDGESSHLYSEAWRMEFVAPTETSKGYTMHYCAVDGCGYSYKSDEYSIMTEGKYVLNANDLEFMEPYSNHMGEVTVYNEVFAAYYFYKTKIDRSTNVFADGFEGLKRINFQGPTRTAYIDNKLSFIRNCIAITTVGETTINLWGISGDVGRYIIILDANGNVVDSSEPATEKNQVFMYQSKTLPAGTYFIGSYYSDTSGGCYIHKIEVQVGPEQNDVDGSQGLEYLLNEDGQSYSVVGIGTCTDTELVIPSTYQGLPVTKIGEYAFSGCTFLKSVTINEGLTRIERWALSDCTSLTTVNLSSTVTYTGYATFVGCTSLVSINVNENSEHYQSIDGNLYTKDGKTFVQYAIGKTDTSYEILDTVTCIASCAFECCTSLKNVTIPNGVTSIKQFAFAACTNLESIIIPDSVTSIAGWVFSSCPELKTVIIGNGLTSIGNWAFQVCPNITSIVIPESVTNIDIGAFYLCDSLTIYCEAETQPSDWNSRWNYSNNPVVWGYKAASEGLEYALNDDGQSYSVVGIGTCTDTELVIPSTHQGLPVTKIGDEAFAQNWSIISIIIPDSVKVIKKSAFEECNSLQSVFISESVTSIEDRSFLYCPSLKEISVGENNNSYKSIDGSLYSKNGNLLIQYAVAKTDAIFCVPDSVTHIGDSAFLWCASLVEIRIPNSVIDIGNSAFQGCVSLNNVIIGSSVTRIGNGAFNGCDSIENVTISASVMSIGEWAFSLCPLLKAINFEGRVEEWNGIEKGAEWDYQTDDYTIYCTDGTIAKDGTVTYYVQGSQGLEYALNDDGQSYSVVGIGTCTDTELVIPSTHQGLPVTIIGDWAFEGCMLLTSVEIPNSVITIGDYAFAFCPSLANVVIGDSVTSIGSFAFLTSTSLKKIEIPNSVISLADYAFFDCVALENIHIPASVKSIGYRVFDQCHSLTSIEVDINNQYYQSISGHLYTKEFEKTLVAYAQGNSNSTYAFTEGVWAIGDYAFCLSRNLETVSFDPCIKTVGSYAFYGCDNLKNVYISSLVTQISSAAFSSCSLLENITYNGTIDRWLAIDKGEGWDANTGNYTIYCTDGTIAKDGTVTYYK